MKIDAVEPEIEKACEVENFDLAEEHGPHVVVQAPMGFEMQELEHERKDLAQQLADLEKAHCKGLNPFSSISRVLARVGIQDAKTLQDLFWVLNGFRFDELSQELEILQKDMPSQEV